MTPRCQLLGPVGAMVFLLVFSGSVAAQVSLPARPAIAVLEFDYGAVKVQWPSIQVSRRNQQVLPTLDALDVGKGIANLLVAELATSGELRLIERQRIGDIARETQGGDDVRARYLVMGSVTKFGGEQKTRAGGALATTIIGIATHRPIIGLFKIKDTYAHVDLSCRVVDTMTGEIVGAATAVGQSKRRGLLLGGLGGRQGINGGAISVDSADFQGTLLGEATAAAVKDAADKLRMLLASVS
jgi:curli biogenesis system outer membrane secretion channel CsgG